MMGRRAICMKVLGVRLVLHVIIASRFELARTWDGGHKSTSIGRVTNAREEGKDQETGRSSCMGRIRHRKEANRYVVRARVVRNPVARTRPVDRGLENMYILRRLHNIRE